MEKRGERTKLKKKKQTEKHTNAHKMYLHDEIKFSFETLVEVWSRVSYKKYYVIPSEREKTTHLLCFTYLLRCN